MFDNDEFLIGDIYKNDKGEVLFITNRIGNSSVDGIYLDGKTLCLAEKEELEDFKLIERTKTFRWWVMYDYYARKKQERWDGRSKIIKDLGGPSIVAERVGVSRTTINFWMHGAKLSIPSRKKLFDFAAILGVPMEDWD